MSKPFDGAAFGERMVAVVKAHVDTTTKPLREALDAAKADSAALRTRIKALEERAAVPGPQGPTGEKGDVGPMGTSGPAGPPGPAGKDGQDGAPGTRGEPGEKGERGDIGPQGPPGKDGREGADGHNGQDGRDGAPGRDGDAGPMGPQGEKGLDGKDGRDGQPGIPGRDGQDGLGFDDLSVVYDGIRTLTFKMARGERVKEASITLPIVLDQGVWDRERSYVKGDGTTFRGCFWIAQRDTSAKPGDGEDWRLAVKRGRDSKGI